MAVKWIQKGFLLRRKSEVIFAGRQFTCSSVQRHVGPAARDVNEIEAMLAEPSWSVNTLFPSNSHPTPSQIVSRKQLHHLLRLSALPLPTSEAEEIKMLKDLETQLQFVRAIQQADTEEVEPLVSIRDETAEAEKEDEITLETLKPDFAKEKVSGIRGRITRSEPVEREADEDWDALACAPKTVGRYIALDNKNSTI